MKLQLTSTSDKNTSDFAKELYDDLNDSQNMEVSFTETDNFSIEVYQAGITFALFIGGIITKKVVEKTIDYIYERVKSKIVEKENYDIKVTITIVNEGEKLDLGAKKYNLLTDIEEIKQEALNEK